MNNKYEIIHVTSGDYLLVRPFVVLTRELIHQYTVEANALCNQVSCRGYLFDMRGIPNVSSSIDNYEFVYRDMQEMGLSRRIRSAILVNEGETTHSFPEVMLHNAGYNIRMFTDEIQAIDWLTGSM